IPRNDSRRPDTNDVGAGRRIDWLATLRKLGGPPDLNSSTCFATGPDRSGLLIVDNQRYARIMPDIAGLVRRVQAWTAYVDESGSEVDHKSNGMDLRCTVG